jgi:hypothetical protein
MWKANILALCVEPAKDSDVLIGSDDLIKMVYLRLKGPLKKLAVL